MEPEWDQLEGAVSAEVLGWEWLLSLLEEHKQAGLVRGAVLGDEVREVGRGGACGTLWPMVRRQEGGGQGQELCGISLGLVLWALLSPLHLDWVLPAALVPAVLVGLAKLPS